ncbi:hypothetical protein ACFS3B_00045 [Brucella rhizosphaerae]|uniref:hypothetical protein n=1 Tax=Brucella rhizosphaerae TaxID=571254 RepID=UPI00362EA0C4
MIHPLIIGSGPAGVSAAQTIVDNAKLIEHLTGQVVKPVMLSEAAFPGGQGLRRLNRRWVLNLENYTGMKKRSIGIFMGMPMR